MGCYCLQEMKKHPTHFMKIDFSDINSKDQTLYCEQWFYAYGTQNLIKYGSPVVIAVINLLVTLIFDGLGDFMKSPTVNQRTSSTFKKITVIQYFNIAVLTLLINMKVNVDFIDGWPVFNGDYKDFDVSWYKNIGAQLSFTLLLNTFSPHVSKIAQPFIAKLK